MPLRALRAIATTSAAALLAAGCGGGAGPLPDVDLERALLTADTLGAGWVQQPESEESDGPDGPSGTGAGCLDDAGELEDVEPTDKESASFTWTNGSLSVANGVGAYDDADEVATQFDDAFEKLEDCTEVSTEAQGATMQARISADRETTADSVDSQLNIEATGTLSSAEQAQDFTIRITLARVGSHVTTVQTVGGAGVAGAHAAYVEIAVDRLAAVTDGEDPPETVAPSPGAG